MRLLIFIYLLFLVFSSNAAIPIVLEDKDINKDYIFSGTSLDVYEDKTTKLTFEEVSSPAFQNKFKARNKITVQGNDNIKSAYWVRFVVQNKSSRKTGWVIELYDFKIDSFELYIPNGAGGFVVEKGGDAYVFNHREYLHKNFAFNHPIINTDKPQVYFLKVYAQNQIGIIGAIRTSDRFLHYATIEYYLLALFYGTLFSMGLYHLFLFFSVKDRSYLFYVLYLLSFGLYAMCLDGTGFQFLWGAHPGINRYIAPLALLSVMVCILLYAKHFLVTRKNSRFFDQAFILLVIIRIVIYIIGLFFNHQLFYRILSYYDTFCMAFIFVAGIDCYFWKKYTPAKYYILAFTFFFIGFIFSVLFNMSIVKLSVYTAYSLNIGVLGQMFLLSLALGDKIKILIREKGIAQAEMIVQLREKEQLKDKVNRELEQKVFERTKELEEKNTQLDTFVYKASHDIKGPLKSVIGLTKIALKDVKDPSAFSYFEHIYKSTTRLDNLLSELLMITKIQQGEVEKSQVKLKELIEEVISSFQNFEGYDKIRFKVSITQGTHFFSDRKLLYSIIQNMVENAIKYRDVKKSECTFFIEATSANQKLIMRFKDNGLGIPKDFQDKIFKMFFKINEHSVGSGLGLHIVKLALEKLNGKITVESTEGEGTVFQVEL